MESKGIWFNKVDPTEVSMTPHTWGDYFIASERFLLGEFTTNNRHYHLMDTPRFNSKSLDAEACGPKSLISMNEAFMTKLN